MTALKLMMTQTVGRRPIDLMAVVTVTPRGPRTEMVAGVVAEVVARTVVTALVAGMKAIVWERVVLSTPV